MASGPHLLCIRPVARYKKILQYGDGQFRWRGDGQSQYVLLLCAAHGQDPMGWHGGHGFLPLEIVFVLSPFALFAGHYATGDNRFFKEQVANPRPGLLVFVNRFGNDVPCAGQGRFNGVYGFFRVHVAVGQRDRVRTRLGENGQGQRFQPPFAGNGGLGSSLGPVGQVDVLQTGHRFSGLHLGFEILCQMAVLLQGIQNGFPPAVQLLQLGQPVPDGGHRHFVQTAGGLFAVAGNEGHGGSVFEQLGNGFDLCLIQAHFCADRVDMERVHRGVPFLFGALRALMFFRNL